MTKSKAKIKIKTNNIIQLLIYWKRAVRAISLESEYLDFFKNKE